MVMQKSFILFFIALFIALPVFAQTGTVVGTVSTEDGDPAVRATVVLDNGGGRPMQTQTDNQGAFGFDRVPVGNYHITATLQNEGTAEDDIVVNANQQTVVNLVLEGGGNDEVGSVTGFVFRPNNNEVENATVVLTNERREEFETQTNHEGWFGFEEVAVGNWHIAAFHQDFGEAEDDIEVNPDEDTHIDLTLREGGGDDVGSIAGTVFDGNDNTIEGATVTITNDRREHFETQTDREGRFGFAEVSTGNWHISASHRDVGEAEDDIVVNANEETYIDLVLEGGGGNDEVGSVGGRVSDTNGNPVDGARITLDNDDGGHFETQTFRGGMFSFPEVPVGDWHITASMQGVGTDEDDIVVNANQQTVVNLVLEEGGNDDFGTVFGVVSTENGNAAANANVHLESGDHSLNTLTNREGLFNFAQVPPGTYHITATLHNVGRAEADIAVVANEETEINLVLVPVGVEEQEKNIPVTSALLETFPNPFNAVATVDYTLPAAGFVNLSVFNTEGRLIQTLTNSCQMAGEYQNSFNGSSLPAGSYILRLRAGNQTKTMKLLLLK